MNAMIAWLWPVVAGAAVALAAYTAGFRAGRRR